MQSALEIVRAAALEKPRLIGMLDEYLRELASHRDIQVGARCAQEYSYLDAYWLDAGRQALFIRDGDKTVGFALIRDPRSTKSGVFEMAEFYVMPEARRRGIGRSAAVSILKSHPGKWELQVHSRNAAALGFWESCVEAVATDQVETTMLEAADGRRTQINFCVPGTA